MTTDDSRKLLQRAVRLFPRVIASSCGNVEGTPCDDMRPSYVCPLHQWLKDAREMLRKM